MYQSKNSGEVSVKEYIEDLVRNISSTYLAEDFVYEKDIAIDDFNLDMDVLVPCSLILNEIITNVFKYGFKSNTKPCLRLHVKENEGEVSMIISDNGPGMEENNSDEREASLGTRLIESLAIQINADVQVDSAANKGVCYTIKFKI